MTTAASKIKSFMARTATALALATTATAAFASPPGCMGKMWNPLTDLDFTLMGGIKVAGFKLMAVPQKLGEPPKHNIPSSCTCKNGLQTGIGISLTFWMPSYINDVARQAGCLGFLNGVNILPGFLSLSSSQEYANHDMQREGTTNMQVHWAYADVTAIAGKALFEKCNAVRGSMEIGYLTEVDFVFQNDVYSAVMTPQVAILAANPMLSQLTCGFESIANTLGDWRDIGVCGWKGTRLPLSANAISKDSAQVTNMDVTLKYLTRSAILGTTLRTMGPNAICEPDYNPFYDPFQHRYQWSYPGKVATRYNKDVVTWGMFIKDQGQQSIAQLQNNTLEITNSSAVSTGSTAPGGSVLSKAAAIVKQLPKPLNYPSKEAGYMQVWEARQCCMMVLTVQTVIEMAASGFASMNAELKQIQEYYNVANKVYQVVHDPIGAALGFVGEGIAKGVTSLSSSVASGLSASMEAVTSGLSK